MGRYSGKSSRFLRTGGLTDPATIRSSCNWAVGSFIFGSILMHEYCQRRRSMEKQGMKRAVEVLERHKADKQKRVEEKVEDAKAARARAKDQG